MRWLLPVARIGVAIAGLALLAGAASAQPTNRIPAYGAIAPQARTSYIGGPPATFFVSLVNDTGAPLTNCFPRFQFWWPPGSTYQTVNAQNQLTGTQGTPANLPIGGTQGFLLALPVSVANVYAIGPEFQCDQGLSTLTPSLGALFSVAASPLPDVIAISATLSNDGVARVDTTSGATFMAVAGVNIGAAGQVDVFAVDNSYLPVPAALSVCETNPTTGACLAPPAPSVRVNYGAGETRTFTLFAIAQANGGIPFWPDAQRIHLNFQHVAGGWTVGDTSSAITAPAPAGASHGPGIWITRFDESDSRFSPGILGLWGDGRALFWGGGGSGVWGGASSEWLWPVKNASISGNIWTGQSSNVVIALRDDTVSGGSGILEPRLSFLGTYGPSAAGQTGIFRGVMDAVATDFSTSAATLAGSYDVLSGVNGNTDIGDAVINANGTWTGHYSVTGSTNCLWSGPFTQESGKNFFTIVRNFQGVIVNCPPTINRKTFSGFATQTAILGNGGAVLNGFVVQDTVEPFNALTFRLRKK